MKENIMKFTISKDENFTYIIKYKFNDKIKTSKESSFDEAIERVFIIAATQGVAPTLKFDFKFGA
jgi:hypothetical protein